MPILTFDPQPGGGVGGAQAEGDHTSILACDPHQYQRVYVVGTGLDDSG